MSRDNFVEACKQQNREVLNGRYRLKYKRDKHGRPVGLVISFKDEDGVRVGWSKCHTKLEPFDKHIGINKAINNTYNLDTAQAIVTCKDDSLLPNSLRQDVADMVERAQRYFNKVV